MILKIISGGASISRTRLYTTLSTRTPAVRQLKFVSDEMPSRSIKNAVFGKGYLRLVLFLVCCNQLLTNWPLEGDGPLPKIGY